MESVLTQNAKTVAPQDAVLNLLSTTKASDDGEQFDKVFEDTSKKLTTEEEEEGGAGGHSLQVQGSCSC